MATSVLRVDSDLFEVAKQHGQLFNRSIAGQIEHWARIGRAIEAAPDFSMRQVAEVLVALEGKTMPDHPHLPIAAMEAAIEVLGMRIAELSAELYRERRSTTRNDAKVDEYLARISELRELQEQLKPEDTELVHSILSGKIPQRGNHTDHP